MSLERLLDRLGIEKHEIGRPGMGRYLTRWVLWGRRGGRDSTRRNGPGRKVFLHWIHRSDAEPYCHNHPWPFWSLILWGGYWEETADSRRSWKWPGFLLRRPADWFHRVEVPAGQCCWSLVWTGPKAQTWGFLCPGRGWINWREHAANQAAGVEGCGDV